jgi:L-ascorbate metabolism protein UlaG (beta-lactamase superfamily)
MSGGLGALCAVVHQVTMKGVETDACGPVRAGRMLAVCLSFMSVGCQTGGAEPGMPSPATNRAGGAESVERRPASTTKPAEPARPRSKELEYLYDRQAEVCLSVASDLLDRFPPRLPGPADRQTALLLLDGVFHEQEAPKRPAVQAFHHARITKAAEEIATGWSGGGAVIWKLYDHAFVVRTATVTLAFDLTRGGSAGAAGFPVADEVMGRIVDQCDVLFISHLHGDHADEWVARRFLDQGKPVVGTPDLWADKDIHEKITHLRRQADTRQELAIQGGRRTLGVVVYPGHQKDVANNVVLVTTPEGLSFCHTGDQSNGDDFGWMDRVSEHHRVDVLIPNCWTPEIARMARGINPAIMITGHEDELGHMIEQRKPYWMTYDRTAKCACPVLVMTWGESYRYVRDKTGRPE